jgi:hypothetical protein
MNDEGTEMPGGERAPSGGEQAPGGQEEARQPTEEELRAALEQQMREVRVEDVLLQSVASLVNLSARRIAKEDERDLDQARIGIEAVRAVVDLLPDEAAGQVRNALSELQTLYAQTAGGPPAGEGGGEKQAPEGQPGQGGSAAPGQAPKSKLWTPGSG